MIALKTLRRRWFQFSLRSLLVLALVGGAGLGWVGWRFDWAAKFAGRNAAPLPSSRVRAVALGVAEPPTDAEILAAWRKNQAAQQPAADVRIVTELLSNYVEPPRVYPLLGKAQLAHGRYKCTVYYESRGGPQVAIIYVDKSHLQQVDK